MSHSKHSTNLMVFLIVSITAVPVDGWGIEQNFWSFNIPNSGVCSRANFIFCTEHSILLSECLEDVQAGVGEFRKVQFNLKGAY